MSFKLIARCTLLFAAILIAASISSGEAGAISFEQAKAQCHDQLVPVVQTCVRKKWAESGGSLSQYIAGCREAVLPEARACIAKLMGAASAGQGASQAETNQGEIDLVPPSGKGRAVLVISGRDRTGPYRDFAQRIAQLGYYTAVIDGNEILSEDFKGGERLQAAITKLQSSPNALAGKIVVIGFSMGGGGALTYAERMPNSVSAVIAYSPVTSFVAKSGDMKSYVEKFQVPALIFSGAKDTFLNCCLLATAKAMDATAKELGKPMELVVYPDAGHDFTKGPNVRPADADDAWRRTTDALRRYLGETASR